MMGFCAEIWDEVAPLRRAILAHPFLTELAAGTLPFLLARGIGQTFLSKDVVLDDVAAFLDADRAG